MTASALSASVPPRFVDLIANVTSSIEDRPLDGALAKMLDFDFPSGGAWFVEMEALCRQGVADGWLCAREQAGIKFGRPIKPGPATHGFSVDVVEMDCVVGPQHSHPNGEIDLLMPLDGEAAFDGKPAGWTVYGPGSAHRPTVSGGRALVLYLLPQGAIDFVTA